MTEKPLVTIACLCYNQGRFVVESLESIKSQTYTNYEVLIIDDFSQKDNSVEIINDWIKKNTEINITFIKHPQNKGICNSINELLDLSKGKYFQMLALDDVLLPWKLEKHVEILENSMDNEALVFTDAYLMDENSILYQNRFIATHKNYLSLKTGNFFDELLKGMFIPGMTVLLKTDIIKSVGGWDNDLLYEDYDMWLRLSEKGYDFIFDTDLSCNYRLHSQNTHKNTSLFGAPTFQIYLKFSNYPKVHKILKENLEATYRGKNLTTEHKLYFSRFKAKKISDYFIKYNLPVIGYRILRFFRL
ncbi:MAG: Chondroitin polymerase [Bacteroidota bacterium]|jgi:glycosyltransferase involved in cell wall biosynthesis